MTSGKNFYGPGGPYENFAGRDATRGLACQSFDEGMLTKDLDGPLDECEDLGEEERSNLQGWVERFEEKVRCFHSLLRLGLRGCILEESDLRVLTFGRYCADRVVVLPVSCGWEADVVQ